MRVSTLTGPLLLPTVLDILAPANRRLAGWAFWLAVLGLALLTASCGARPGRVPVYAARGQVLFQGRPTPHSFIALHPLDPTHKDVPHPTAYADAAGRFELSTYASGDGAPAGDYAVTIVLWVSAPVKDAQEGDDTPTLNRLPRRYSDAKTTNLRAHISQGANELTFQLTR
jgi:hypothetical protein